MELEFKVSAGASRFGIIVKSRFLGLDFSRMRAFGHEGYLGLVVRGFSGHFPGEDSDLYRLGFRWEF